MQLVPLSRLLLALTPSACVVACKPAKVPGLVGVLCIDSSSLTYHKDNQQGKFEKKLPYQGLWDSWSQFHQHSTCSFYVRKLHTQLFCTYVLGLYFTGVSLPAQKLCVERWWNWALEVFKCYYVLKDSSRIPQS